MLYEEKREQQEEYQLALPFSNPAKLLDKNFPLIRKPFTPLRKAPDPVIQEAFAILRQKHKNEEAVKAPPIPLSQYFSLLRKNLSSTS